MSDAQDKLLTVLDLSLLLDVPVYRIDYALKRAEVIPDCVLGNARLFREDQLGEVKTALGNVRFKKCPSRVNRVGEQGR